MQSMGPHPQSLTFYSPQVILHTLMFESICLKGINVCCASLLTLQLRKGHLSLSRIYALWKSTSTKPVGTGAGEGEEPRPAFVPISVSIAEASTVAFVKFEDGEVF